LSKWAKQNAAACVVRRDRYRLKTFKALDGYLAFTLDIAGRKPFSVCVPLAQLDRLLHRFAEHSTACRLDDLLWRARARLNLVGCFKGGRQKEATLLALWLALNYAGGDTKQKVQTGRT
jgi:hypothetical protein